MSIDTKSSTIRNLNSSMIQKLVNVEKSGIESNVFPSTHIPHYLNLLVDHLKTELAKGNKQEVQQQIQSLASLMKAHEKGA